MIWPEKRPNGWDTLASLFGLAVLAIVLGLPTYGAVAELLKGLLRHG